MAKTLTVKKGDLKGKVQIYINQAYGGVAVVRCPDYFGDYHGEKVGYIGVSECVKCKFFQGIIEEKSKLFIGCARVRVRKVKKVNKLLAHCAGVG